MFSGSDHLELMLIQPETTVEEVLNYAHFTDELSSRNPALLEFLGHPDRVRDLVEIVRRGPNPSYPPERQYQLSYLATETLTSETWTIQDALLQNEEALDGLYSILQTEDPASLLPLTASFLHRILVYLSKWAGPELLSFLKSKPDFVDCVIRHMDKAAVPEILYHLLNTANYKTFLSTCQWLDEAQLVQKLLDVFLSGDLEIRAYACQFICGLLHVCRSHRYRFLRPLSEDGQTNPLLSRLESEETFGQVVSTAFSDETRLSDNRQFIPMALCLLRNILIPSTQPETCVQLPELPAEGRETELEPTAMHLIERLSPHLSSLKALLLLPSPQFSSEKGSSSSASPSLGSLRIHVIRFLCYILESGSPTATKEFVRLGLLGVIMELFFEHKWHTFLHASFEYLVRLIVNRASALTTDDYSRSDFLSSSLPNGTLSASEACTLKSPECRKRDSGSPTPSSEISTGGLCNGHCEAETSTDAGAVFCEPFPRLLHQLLVEYQFLDRLMKAWDENENLRGKPKVRRAGYMGHLRSIANSLNDFLPPSALARPVRPSNGTAGASGQDGAPGSQTATGDCAPECSQPTPARPTSADTADRSTGEGQLGEVLFAMIPLDVRMRWSEFVQGDLARSNNAAFIDYANFPNSSSSSSVSTDDEVSRYKISDDAISAALQNAYQHYCSNQSLSASFPDLFGYAEDEFDDCRERLDVVIEQALSGLNFNLTIQEDTVNNSLFEQACNELVIAEGGEEVGDESVGLPIVCMETTTPTQPRLSNRSTAEASTSPNVDGDRQRGGKEAPSPILCRQPLGKTSLAQSLPTAAEVSQAPTEGHLKQLSLGRLKEVFSTPTVNTEQPQENSSAPTTEEDEQDRAYGHLREASRRGDEALPDFASSSVATAPTIAVTPSRLSLSGRTPHLDPHADRHTSDSFVSSPPLSPSPTKELHPRLALAPGPTPSNGQPIMSVGRARRLSASPTADLPPWIDMFDDSKSPMMRGSLNAANEASADALGDTTADSVPPLRYTSRKYTWSAPPSPVRGPRSSTAPVKETRTDLHHVVSSELPDADSFILPRVPLLASDLNSNSSASSSSNSVKPDPTRSPVSVAVCSSTSDAISAAPTTATSALFVTYDQAPVFALPSYSIPRPIQPTVRSHRLTRISLPNGRRMVGPGDEATDPAAAATAVLETTNSASPTSFRAAINTPEMVMQILNGTVPDSSPAGRRLPASPSSSVFEDRSRVKRRVGRLTDGGEEVEEVGCYSPHRGGALFGRPALSAAVSNGSLELPQGVLLSRRPPPFVISESEFDEEEEGDEEDGDGEGYPVEEQLLTQNRFRTHTTLNLKKNARDVETL